MADTLYLISTISFALATICLIVSIAIFVVYKIPDVIGDLSGKNAKKSIKQFRESNEKSGNKSFRPSKTNNERGKLTETAHGFKGAEYTSEIEDGATGILSENMYKNEAENDTELLLDNGETAFLPDDNETASLLEDEISQYEVSKNKPHNKIEILDEVIMIHTDKII